MQKHLKHLLILFGLLGLFSTYNFVVYTSESAYQAAKFSEKALQGETLWLKNNCNACHQIYGLGGYLGPDVTNVYSTEGKGEPYIKIILNSGIQSMPLFSFNEAEKEQFVQFFKEVDQTGYYPDVTAQIEIDGWVSIKNKIRSDGK